ncbi:hypothetical protein BEN49_24555 [Hymenobacter coccineus]|uniref:Uncharacterized protein n=1 Tax=Hymenobacter coccineus TaxID=1908235 RepID=A0A1G1TFU7_9BACT|nr:hypothetical protein BEN49_24555 [Hymenobacter coccineus]
MQRDDAPVATGPHPLQQLPQGGVLAVLLVPDEDLPDVRVALEQGLVAAPHQHVHRRGGLVLGQVFYHGRGQNHVADERRLDEQDGRIGLGHGGG